MQAAEITSAPANGSRKTLGRLIFLMAVRTLVNTLHRMVYPFLPVFSRELGVSPAAFSQAIGFRSLAGLASPAFSHLADSRGRRFGMLLGMALFLGAVLLLLAVPRFISFFIALFIASLGKSLLDNSIQAFISDEVPRTRRGAAVATVELGWSLSYLLGIPAIRFLMEGAGWTAVFPILGVLGLTAVIGIIFLIPKGTSHHGYNGSMVSRARKILVDPSIRAAVTACLMISAANELVNVTFAVWLEDAFQVRLAALAAAALVIGMSELLGEALVGGFTDRLGSVRAVRIGLMVNCTIAVLLPFFVRSIPGAYAGLFLFYLSFEFTLVSTISLLAGLRTDSRATLMGINITGVSFGRMAATWIALPVYALGFPVVLALVVALNLFGFWMLGGVALAHH